VEYREPRLIEPSVKGAGILCGMARELREVVYVDGVRTAFGRAGEGGLFWKTRADDMAVKTVRELLRRNPGAPPERIGDVAMAATAQVGDQGLTLGRDVALLAGLPHTVPGFAVDRMCAGALTAVTAAAGEIAMGACDLAIAGGVEHMGHHPMGEDVDFNPRFVAERLIDESAAVMGQTAENLHDAFPHLTKEDADRYAAESQRRASAAWGEPDGVYARTVVPMSVFTDDGWKVAERDEFLRPDTTLEGLAGLKTPFRAGGRVTAGNSAGLTDGATASLLASEAAAAELGLEPRMRLVGFAYAGVEPHLMGLGPVPATKQLLERERVGIDDIGLFELNEPFAVQVLSWCDGVGVAADDPRLNPYGGAIACGHPLAATGVRLMAQLAHGFERRPDVRYGLTALCIGLGMGAALLWENTRRG
jgi:acetyl-CoA acyltransferase